MSIEAIVAVDNAWGIGNKGELLCRVREDLRNFRSVTSGKTVILGSKTLATFPNGQPLKNRRNIILSRREDYKVDLILVKKRAYLRFKRFVASKLFLISHRAVYARALRSLESVSRGLAGDDQNDLSAIYNSAVLCIDESLKIGSAPRHKHRNSCLISHISRAPRRHRP